MGYGDLVPHRKIGSNTIIKGNIDENVSIMPILPEIVTFVKFSFKSCNNFNTFDMFAVATNLSKVSYF